MTQTESLIVLNALPISPKRIKQLIEHFGDPQTICEMKDNPFPAESVAGQLIENIHNFPKDSFLKREYNLLDSHKVTVVTIYDQGYPRQLKEIPDAPPILYVKGDSRLLHERGVALVGSRRCSLYGMGTAEKLAAELSDYGLTIISGLAKGVDTHAHRGALKAGGKTVAVLGCGLSSVYPRENKSLFDNIARNGLVVSEFSMETPPIAYNFPRRNRIISGLSLGVVVVEASQKSGALITADFALEQGREVFAIPGKIDSPTSFGVNRLIKDGAKLVCSVDDILEELRCTKALKRDPLPNPRAGSGEALNHEENRVYESLSDEPLTVDALSSLLNHDVSSLMGILLSLELKKRARQLPGKLFVRT